MFYLLLNPIKSQILVFFFCIVVFGNCLPFNGVTFIVDYIKSSELQVPFYTVVVCGGQDRNVLLSVSAAHSKLFLLRGPNQKNITEWNINDGPQGFILDMSCPHSQEILQQADELVLFRKPYSWLLISEEVPSTAVSLSVEDQLNDMSGLKDKYIRIDGLVVIALPFPTKAFELFEVYKITENSESIVRNLGKWTEGNGFTFTSTQTMARRRRDLNGLTLVGSVVITQNGTMEHVSDLINVHHDSPTKIAYGVYQTISQHLNVKFEYIEANSWGAFVNGSWNGMVGDMAGKKAEVGICPAFLTPERMPIIEYFHGIADIKVGFIVRAPPLSYSNNLFTLPFSFSVWLSSIGTILAALILLFIANKFECDILKVVVIDKETLNANVSEITLMNVATVCQQGYNVESRGVSGRIVTITLYLSVMFLFVSYSASIVALLQSSDYSMRTVKDLLDSPLQVGAEDVPYQRHWLKSTTDPVRQELYKKKIIPRGEAKANFLKIVDGIEKVRTGQYAYHVDFSAGYNVIQGSFNEAEKCGLMELRIFLQVPEPWIPIRRNSPYAELFKISAKIGAEMGVESRTTRRYIRKKPPCIASGSNFVSVGLLDCYRIFLMLTYSMVAAIFLLILEISSKSRKMRNSLFYKSLVKRNNPGKRKF